MMGSDPKTEAGRLLLAHIERLNYGAYDAARAAGYPGEWPAAIRAIEEEAARLVSPDREGPDREFQIAVLTAALQDTYERGADGTEGALSLLTAIEDAGLRLGQREDAPLDAAWREAETTTAPSPAANLREPRP